jgi:septal ring factor EnvC (AmiA/AmiB activator)
MNAILKKILYTIAAIYFIISIIGGAYLSSRLECTRQELEYYRTEFNAAQNREQQLTNEIDECFGNVTRTNEILSQSTNTISDIRKQFKEIRESYEQMESILMGNDISSDNK